MTNNTFKTSDQKTLSHQGEISIDTLIPESVVLGLDSGKEVLNHVEEVEHIKKKKGFYLINGSIVMYKDQSIFANDTVLHVKQLKVGDILFGLWYKKIPVTSIEKIEGEYTFHRLKVSGNHSYFLDNILVHNATRYWVGGTGNWDAATTTHWAATSGGATGASVPTSVDDVIFDTLSNTTAYTVTLTATATCRDFTLGAPLTGKVTFTGSTALDIYGSINLSGGLAGITWSHTGALTMRATSGTKTITTNSVILTGNFTFNGSGGTFQLQDTLNLASFNIILTAGTFDPNGQIMVLTATQQNLLGAWSLYDLSIIPTTPAKNVTVMFNSNVTINGTLLTNSGATATNRVIIRSTVIGTPRILTVATNSLQNVDFQDITAAGAANWNLSAISGLSGDCGGNTGITFTAAANMYWKSSVTAAFSDLSKWFLASNGAGGAGRVPLPQDTAIFDANSFTTTGITVRQDMPRMGAIDFTGVTNNPTWTVFSTGAYYGSWTFTSGMTIGASALSTTYQARGNTTIDLGGNTYQAILTLDPAAGSTITLNGDFTMPTTRTLTINSGTLNTNNYIMNVGGFSLASVATFIAGSATHIISSLVGFFCSGTFIAGTSTLKFTDTTNSALNFVGGGHSFGNVWFDRGASTGAITLFGTNSFNDFKDTGTVAHTIILPNVTTLVTSLSIKGSAGNLITLSRTGGSGTFTISDTSGINNSNYLSISNSTATGGATFYAGANSTDGGGNTGWIFTAPFFSITKSSRYTIAVSTAVTKSAQYAIKAGVPKTKSLKYTIKISPTAIVKNIRYLIKLVSVPTKSARYAIRKTTSVTKATTYRIKVPLAITKTLGYRIKRFTSVSKSVKYVVKKPTAITKSLAYKVSGAHIITKQSRYVILSTTAYSITKNLAYVVVKRTMITKGLKYNIRRYPYHDRVSNPYTKRGSIYTPFNQ